MIAVMVLSGYCDIFAMSGMMEMLDYGARVKSIYQQSL